MDQDGKYPHYPGGAVSGLWQDVAEIPAALATTLDNREGFEAAAELVTASGSSRLVVSGNGAAYYVASALWLASLRGSRPGPEVCAVPSGLVARGRFAWRPGDIFVAVSSSGEFRDLVEAIEQGAPRPYIAVTSSPVSTVARGAGVAARFQVLHQRALTHSQVFCGAVATLLSIWAMVVDDTVLSRQLSELPAMAESAIDQASRWSGDALSELKTVPRAALTCASGAGWAAALEAALLLKEVARVPTEGGETREAATSGMYPLASNDLAFTLRSAGEDPLLDEAEGIFERAGAKVLRAPAPRSSIDERVMGAVMFPAAAALAIKLARLGGFDPDEPTWAATYYQTAR